MTKLNKFEKTAFAFIKACAEDRFESPADVKKALDAFNPEHIYTLADLVDAFLMADLFDAAEEFDADEDEDEDEDEEDFDDEDFDDEDEPPAKPAKRAPAKKAPAKKRR